MHNIHIYIYIYIIEEKDTFGLFFMFFWPRTPIFDPGTPLESSKMRFRSIWSEFELQISDGGPFHEDFYVLDTFLRRYFFFKILKSEPDPFLEWILFFFFIKNTARSWVLISYLHRWTSIYVYLCPEMAKMIAQICKNRRKSKGIPIHNGTEGRPHYRYVFLYFSCCSCIFGLSSWPSLDINRHKWIVIDVISL